MEPVSPSHCKHEKSLFIMSSRSMGYDPPCNVHAHVCAQCGTFIVWVDGAKLEFTLCMDEQLEAAGQYIKLLTASYRG